MGSVYWIWKWDEVSGTIGAVIFGTYLCFNNFQDRWCFSMLLPPSPAFNSASLANLGSNVFGRQTSAPWEVHWGYFRLHPTPLYGAIRILGFIFGNFVAPWRQRA